MGCSPIKAVRELGSERRETVRSLSGVGALFTFKFRKIPDDQSDSIIASTSLIQLFFYFYCQCFFLILSKLLTFNE